MGDETRREFTQLMRAVLETKKAPSIMPMAEWLSFPITVIYMYNTKR
jgi:hypothetical protein